MAPTTSARNASPAQRAVKKTQEDTAKQNPATPKATPKKAQSKKTRNASPAPLAAKKEFNEHEKQNPIPDSEQLPKNVQSAHEEPKKQIELEPVKCTEDSIPLATPAVGHRMSFWRKVTLVAVLMMMIAFVVLQTFYASEVADISTKLRSEVAVVSTKLRSGVAEVSAKLGSGVAEVSTKLGSGVAEVSTKLGSGVAEVCTKLQIATSKALGEIYHRLSGLATKPEQTSADL